MSRRNKKQKQYHHNRPNLWGMIERILVASMNKGQLLMAGFVLFFIILISRFPSNKLPQALDNLLDISKFNSILGWIIAIITTFGGVFITKYQRRVHYEEIERISKEKKELQEKLNNKELPSSKK